jgi:hypothetical protein
MLALRAASGPTLQRLQKAVRTLVITRIIQPVGLLGGPFIGEFSCLLLQFSLLS